MPVHEIHRFDIKRNHANTKADTCLVEEKFLRLRSLLTAININCATNALKPETLERNSMIFTFTVNLKNVTLYTHPRAPIIFALHLKGDPGIRLSIFYRPNAIFVIFAPFCINCMRNYQCFYTK